MYDLSFSPSVPAYIGGKSASVLFNAGGMTADDRGGVTAEDCPMLLITETDGAEFSAYIDACVKAGFTVLFENENDAVRAVALSDGQVRLYAYLSRLAGEVRVIEERAGVPLPEISYAVRSDSSPEIVQYALYYDKRNDHSPTTTNCGMLYIVKLADNSLFMIDGGHMLQNSAAWLAGLNSFLHEFTGVPEGGVIRIAGWYFTHAHDDHMAACVRLLRTYPGQYRIERILHNFPSYVDGPRGHSPDVFILKETLREFCPDAMCLKLHTGQKFTLANADFEVLFTFEDAVNVREEIPPYTVNNYDHPCAEQESVRQSMPRYMFRDFNCTSPILKMTVPGGSVMWLGDTNLETEALVSKTVPAAMWKADVVQVAHHCFNYLTTLYAWIDADWAMLPNSWFGGHTPENTPKLADVLEHLASPENIWYEDRTTGFRFEGGNYAVIFGKDRVGEDWDGVDLYGTKHEIK